MSAEGWWRWAGALPAAVLVLVALVQITLLQPAGLTPWKGGGFGMFSTVDALNYRVVTIELETPDGAGVLSRATKAEVLGSQRGRIAAFPHERAARATADALAEERWEIQGDRAVPAVAGHEVERILLEVEHLHLEEDLVTLTRRPVWSTTLEVER